jgi:hypothetical protein
MEKQNKYLAMLEKNDSFKNWWIKYNTEIDFGSV